MQATFTFDAAEFNESIIEGIKAFLSGQKGPFSITVSVKNAANERREQFFQELDESIAAGEKEENLVTFTLEEFEDFIKK